jgi:class 3 adenylate cyclase
MRALLTPLLRVGADPRDDEDQRLRKLLLVAAAWMILPAAVVWGAIYWAFGERVAALAPWTYVVVSAVTLVVFRVTRNYPVFAVAQFAAWLILPFLLMWALGGFVAGSAVALWAWLAPLGARVVGHRRAAALLFVAFTLGLVVSALIQPILTVTDPLPEPVLLAFFVLNVVAVAAITFALIDASTGGREGSLASMRGMVRHYFSPGVLETILADPSRQELGGEVARVTVLFADMGGFTTYAGTQSPTEVVHLLNEMFAAALPPILAEGGTPVSLPGDAVMAVFGAPNPQPDHVERAARAALAMRAAGDDLARAHPDWPRVRIGLNTGDAVVGNIGSDEYRHFTAIGDTINMAQRFEALAEPGQIVIGPDVAARLDGVADLAPLGAVTVKGKADPIEPSALLGLHSAEPTSR